MDSLKSLGNKLNIKLFPTVREELDAFDKLTILEQQKLPYQRADIVDAYTQLTAARHALSIAQTSMNSQEHWHEALRLAKAADVMTQPLLKAKLLSMGLSTNYSLAALNNIVYYILLSCLAFSLWEEEIKTLAEISTSLITVYILLTHLITLHATKLTLILTTSMTEHVLNAAQNANVSIDNTFIPVIPTTVIKKRNNKQILDKIGVSNVPDKYRCTISADIMDNPVSAQWSDKPYDYENIISWLKTRNIDPSTTQPLYPEDLIPNQELQREIDQFVDKERDKFNRRRRRISLFVMQPLINKIEGNEPSSIDDDVMMPQCNY